MGQMNKYVYERIWDYFLTKCPQKAYHLNEWSSHNAGIFNCHLVQQQLLMHRHAFSSYLQDSLDQYQMPLMHWSEMPLNADHCHSMSINSDQFLSLTGKHVLIQDTQGRWCSSVALLMEEPAIQRKYLYTIGWIVILWVLSSCFDDAIHGIYAWYSWVMCLQNMRHIIALSKQGDRRQRMMIHHTVYTKSRIIRTV